MEYKTTHLSRRLSTINVLALALGCIVGWGAFVLPGDSFLPKGGTLGTGIGLIIATGIMIVIACNYHYMITRIPEAGGEFTYAKNAFGRAHGFICAWFLILSYGVLVPFNSTGLALVARTLLGDFLQWGFHYQVAGYERYRRTGLESSRGFWLFSQLRHFCLWGLTPFLNLRKNSISHIRNLSELWWAQSCLAEPST